MTVTTRNIICMKWGTAYGPEFVNRLYAGVCRHLALPFRFVCFTDDVQGLDAAIETQPLPLTAVPETADTRWRKLAVFKPGLAGLQGPTLFLDLDLVIVSALEDFFIYPGCFLLVRDADLFPDQWLRHLRPRRRAFYQRVGNSSVFRFEAGAQGDVLSRYEREHAAVITGYRNEQEYLSSHLYAQGKLAFWPRSWCPSFKHDCVPRGWRSFFSDPQCPPDAKIILFAGHPKMAEVVAGRGGRWYRRIGRAPWMEQAWTGLMERGAKT